jgi:two-component system, NtrC family, response regulator AlgB
MAKLLIVDDEKNIRLSLATLFQKQHVQTAASGREAMEILAADDFDLVLSDYRMAEMNGLELLREIKSRFPATTVILMTAYATMQNAVAIMKAGAHDHLTKPFSADQVEHVVAQALEIRHLQTENRLLRNTIEEYPFLDSRSPAMRRLLETAEQAAVSDATILLTGESGTGKNVLARQIHRWSQRRQHPFVVVNCTTLSEPLLESELFGHMRGAFTGAIKDKRGRLEAADGGTVFLDEIADLSGLLQTKLLRFVQEQSFERVGGEQTIKVDVRIIAASNRNLQSEVQDHRFREDLFYRLNVITLRVPSLCERADDVLPLAKRMLSAAAVRNHRPQLRLSTEAAEAITRYRWPGNVRELRNAVERATVLSQGDAITVGHLPDSVLSDGASAATPTLASLEEVERQHILRVLSESPRLEDAAASLGIDSSTLWRKRRRYKLDFGVDA